MCHRVVCTIMQNQAPGYFHLDDLRSLHWKILPF
eukprot:COSAG02_NODE_56357_length_286_cov_0.545455_1_plen_33_part_01